MHSNTRSLRRNRKAASPAVSMVIITAATVVLVLISSGYAFQILMRQQATAEFETVQNSILAFDDALRDIAWDEGGSRSVRFTTNYGNMRLIDSHKTITISGAGLDQAFLDAAHFTTAAVRYQMPYDYGGYVASDSASGYFLGDPSAFVSRLNESMGQAFVGQEPGQASITLNYRVRASNGGSIEILAADDPYLVYYVDVFVINMKCESSVILNGDFDLVCRNVGLTTVSSNEIVAAGPLFSVDDGTKTDVTLGDLGLASGVRVILNLIIADVRVST